VIGLAAVPVAFWLAASAPVLGLSAKSTQNKVWSTERQDATQAGLDALVTSPWGGRPSAAQTGINLISDSG